jgi:aryl-alcohol dehydrogenase-like predicted oxidoreductase
MSRSVEREILPVLRELGIGMTAYGVLSRGLISESALAGGSTGGFRTHSPRFQGENLTRNLALVRALKQIADEKRISVAQLAVAWVAARDTGIQPLIGARKRTQLADALAAVDVTLTPEDFARIDAAAPPEAVAGARYPEAGMATLDSER